MSILRSVRKFALLAMLALAVRGLAASASVSQSLTCRKVGNLCTGGCTACINHVRYCCQNVARCCFFPCSVCDTCESVRVSC